MYRCYHRGVVVILAVNHGATLDEQTQVGFKPLTGQRNVLLHHTTFIQCYKRVISVFVTSHADILLVAMTLSTFMFAAGGGVVLSLCGME